MMPLEFLKPLDWPRKESRIRRASFVETSHTAGQGRKRRRQYDYICCFHFEDIEARQMTWRRLYMSAALIARS